MQYATWRHPINSFIWPHLQFRHLHFHSDSVGATTGRIMRRTTWRLALALLGLDAIAAATALSLDDLEVFAPTLPTHIATNDRIEDLELRVYVPEGATETSVRVTPTSEAVTFSPASFVFDAVHAVARFRLEALAAGSCTIEYVAVETHTNASAVLVQQTITALAPPTSYELTDPAWHGVVLQNDSFEQPPTAAGVYRASGFWSHLAHAYPSSACGACDGDRALYFTALGERFAVTTPLNLLGFHGKMHFHHIYGSRSVQTYDRTGDNRVACERVDPGEETVFSYLPHGRDALNRSAWEPLYEVPLSSSGSSSSAFSTHSVLLPTLSMHTAAQFRWQQKNHSSFPIDVASGLTLDAIVAAANDNTSVNGELGRSEQEVWRYRNLFDQWALDAVELEVRLNVPLFTIVASDSIRGNTDVIVQSPIEHSWVEVLVGDGTHEFPSCSATATTTPRAQSSTAHLTVSSYVHAVACLQVNKSLISSFPTRSARVLVQARAPRLTSILDTTASIDTWRVTLACDGCSFMRYTLRMQTSSLDDDDAGASNADERESPSCLYGTLVSAATQVVSVTSNARLQAVACGPDLVMSDIASSEAYVVRPRTPTFAFPYPETTVTGLINVTIVPSDATSVGIAYAIGDNAVLPDCSEIRASSSAAVAGNQTVQVQVSDVVRAVACCMDRVCDDSDFGVWGPLSVRAVAPVSTMACSRVKPLTMVVTIESVTAGASVRYRVGNDLAASPLTCATGIAYTEPVQVSSVSTTVFAISCRDGLQMSLQVAIPVTLDHCCAGIDAYLYPSCAHVLLLADDFATCLDATKWSALTSQWGGTDVNGGVHASNAKCVRDASLDKNVLALHAQGDLYAGTEPVGHARNSADGALRERTVDDAFIEWALDGASTVPCNQLERCAARRVGAAVSTKLELNAGVMVLRLKPCDAFGTLTQIWWGEYEANDALAQQLVPFLPLWKAALAQAKTTPDVPFVLSSPRTNDAFVDVAMQWNASDGRANVYVDGVLVLQQRSSSSAAASLTNRALSIGVWFPNAVAGAPLFPSCEVRVSDVQVFKMEVTGGRWCDILDHNDDSSDDAQQHRVACADDSECAHYVTLHCFMRVYEASCVAHHDELRDFRSSDDIRNDNDETATETRKFCHFRLAPTAHSRVSVTEMTTRTQELHWRTEELAM